MSLYNYLEKNKLTATHGKKGVANLKRLVVDMGYNSLDHFLSENPDAILNIVDWISDNMNAKWEKNLDACVDQDDEVEGEESGEIEN